MSEPFEGAEQESDTAALHESAHASAGFQIIRVTSP
jgi:hypothetical protein